MGRRSRTRRKIASLFRQRFSSDANVPYCCIYDVVPATPPPSDFKPKTYSGLIAWHVIEEPGTPKAVAYWQDEPHYRRSRRTFETDMHIGSPRAKGDLGGLRVKGLPWTPSTLKEWILTLSAVFGAFIAVRTIVTAFVDPLVAVPRGEVAFVDPNPNVVEKGTTSIGASVLNATPFAPVEITGTAHLVDPNKKDSVLEVEPKYPPWVNSGTSQPLTIPWTAPALSNRHDVPISYGLRLQVYARATTIRAPVPLNSAAATLRVWPYRFGWTRSLTIVEQSPTLYHARGVLYSSENFPNGLHGVLTVISDGGVQMNVHGEGFRPQPTQIDSVPAGNLITSQLDFDTPPLEKYHEYPFYVILTSQRARPSGWDAVARQISVVFK